MLGSVETTSRPKHTNIHCFFGRIMINTNTNKIDDELIAIDLEEENEEEEVDAATEAEESSNIPIDGSPVYPHLYVGQSGIPDMVNYDEIGYKGDNYLIWHDIFPDISAGSVYG